MSIPGHDGIETFFSVQRLFLSELYELVHAVHLGHFIGNAERPIGIDHKLAFTLKVVVKPMVESCQCNAVFEHGIPETFNLNLILDSLHQLNRVVVARLGLELTYFSAVIVLNNDIGSLHGLAHFIGNLVLIDKEL